MNDLDMKSIIKTIDDINFEIFDITEDDEIKLVEFKTCGAAHLVTFCGIPIWGSEFDKRMYFRGTDEYESLDGCLRREINYFSDLIGKIRVKEDN